MMTYTVNVPPPVVAYFVNNVFAVFTVCINC